MSSAEERKSGISLAPWAIVISAFLFGMGFWVYTYSSTRAIDENLIVQRHVTGTVLGLLVPEIEQYQRQVSGLVQVNDLAQWRKLDRARDRVLERLRFLSRRHEQFPELQLADVDGISRQVEIISRKVALLDTPGEADIEQLALEMKSILMSARQLVERRQNSDLKELESILELRNGHEKYFMFSFALMVVAFGLLLVLLFQAFRRHSDVNEGLESRVRTSDAALVQKEQERLDAEAALKNSEARFRDFAESSSDWFWEYDEELRFRQISPRYFEIVQIDPEEVIGKKRSEVAMLTNLGSEEKWARHKQRLDLHQQFRDFRYEVMGRDSKPRWISVSGMPTFDIHGNFQGYRGTGTDITSIHMAEEELNLLNRTLETRVRERTQALEAEKERAEHASYAKSEFLANMSHELRTPLNAIQGFSQIMKEEMFGRQANRKYVDYANDINAASSHLLSLITDILDVSKVEAGEFELEESIVDVGATIHSCLRLVSEKARDKSIFPEVTTDPAVNTIHADERILKQILINLLGNAVKFTNAKGRIEVKIALDEDQGLTVSIIDNGVGIENKDLGRVLEPFGQVRESSEIAHEGTGLGLPLAKQFMEMHDGKLTIESRIGIGTTVVLHFPPERTILGAGIGP
jgi:PAS domain S-box-containing protein